MANNFLERHREEYEERKARWLSGKNKLSTRRRQIERTDDESL